MRLITKDTTLDEFVRSRQFFIKDPKTKRICKMKRTTIGITSYYIHSHEMHSSSTGRYLSHNKRRGGVIITTLGELLERIQSGKFRIT